MKFWLHIHPDARFPVGGVKQLHRFAEGLLSLGVSASIVQESASFHPDWFSSSVDTISLKEWFKLKPYLGLEDIAVLPETFIDRMDYWAKGLKKVIFNQNSFYTFSKINSSGLITNHDIIRAYNSSQVLQTLCVSDYDYASLSTIIESPQYRLSKIINAADPAFQFGAKKRRLISYMPRKNPQHSQRVFEILKFIDISSSHDWNIVPIDGMSQLEVSRVLSESSIFLSFGSPEGFGLPVLEALISGCYVVGYDGHGGSELFNAASNFNMCSLVPYGDLVRFVSSIKNSVNYIESSGSMFSNNSYLSSSYFSNTYSTTRMRESIEHAYRSIISRL